jgi:ABC-type multidrug transport system ATPase subunit
LFDRSSSVRSSCIARGRNYRRDRNERERQDNASAFAPGEIAPSSGSLTYPKLSTRRGDWLSIRNQIGYVAQMPERWHGRLRLNLNYTAAAYGSFGKENDELVDWYVHRYGLKEYEDATWGRISGGFKIRFELVRALLTKPKLLVLDEPLAYLDIVTQQIFLSDVRSISSALDNPIPIIITSQHFYEIEAIANKMIILDDGRCLYSGPILQMPHLEEFRTYEIAVDCEKKDLPLGQHNDKHRFGEILREAGPPTRGE